MTLDTESITFLAQGIWIQPILSDGFWFNGSVIEFMSIVAYHTELDMDNVIIRVRVEGIRF